MHDYRNDIVDEFNSVHDELRLNMAPFLARITAEKLFKRFLNSTLVSKEVRDTYLEFFVAGKER